MPRRKNRKSANQVDNKPPENKDGQDNVEKKRRKNKKGANQADNKPPENKDGQDNVEKKRRKNKKGANQADNKPPENKDGQDNVEKKTPYQGKSQAFGIYRCSKCNRTWMSNVSWANFGQQCNKCKINVYPRKQLPLDSDKTKKINKCNPNKNHPKELCEKCHKLGRFCGQRKKIKNKENKHTKDDAVKAA